MTTKNNDNHSYKRDRATDKRNNINNSQNSYPPFIVSVCSRSLYCAIIFSINGPAVVLNFGLITEALSWLCIYGLQDTILLLIEELKEFK